MKKVIEILADPDCEVIRPICIDYNLVEVNAGHCWSIRERRFLERDQSQMRRSTSSLHEPSRSTIPQRARP